MSYILDALKRADAERQRGTVPSLHARQITTPALPNTSGAQNRRWLAAGAVLMLGAAAAGGVWFWRAPSGDAPRPVDTHIALTRPAPAASPPPLPALAAPAPTSTPLPVPMPVTAAPVPQKPEPAPTPEVPPRRVVAPKPAPPPPAAAAPAAPKSKADTTVAKATPASASASPQPAPTPEPAPKSPPKTAPSRAAPAEVPLLSELPENIRRQIPAMAINGVVYSENPGQRVLLVNQQVLTPGSQAVPDVKLEEIRPHSSVFSFQGTRFRLAH